MTFLSEGSYGDLDVGELDIVALKNRLPEEDMFIADLIDTIPPKFYFDQEVQEKLTADKHTSMDETTKGIKRNFPKTQELTAKTKHKRARLDPQQHKLVSQVQQEMEQEKTPKLKKSVISSSATLTRAANIQELQKRLQERIQELQGKRRGISEKEFAEKKRLKRKMQRMKKKQKGNMNKPVLNSKDKNESKTTKQEVKEKPKPIYNKDGKIIYSKFDFTESGERDFKKKKRNKKKNLKKLIGDAEKNQQKIQNIKDTDPEKANELVKKNAWHRAIQKAEGVKLKDDPALLKKSMKKREKQKSRSSKEWKNRVEHTEKMQKARQEKRKKNIQAMKKEKFDKKIKRAKKKGRIIPGF